MPAPGQRLAVIGNAVHVMRITKGEIEEELARPEAQGP
jgi:hypothetical protein